MIERDNFKEPISYTLSCVISPEEHIELAALTSDEDAVTEYLRKLGSRHQEGEYAVLRSVVEVGDFRNFTIHGYVDLGPDKCARIILPSEVSEYGLPPENEAMQVYYQQTASRLEAAKQLGEGAMLMEIVPSKTD